MIESSKYLVNQLLHDRTGDRKYDNATNGLSSWLLGYMQRIAQHDFLEFNARPYARLALHSLYNLHEFAGEELIRTGAQILLDYTMVKFAISSNRGRRVSPYRRLQPRINHQANARNDLYAELGDQVAGHFMAYTGLIDGEGKPARFPESLAYPALLSATAAYRPPLAAYMLAMNPDTPACLHRFYHGTRRQLPLSSDIAEGGLEIYYRSPSFLLSAGGMFLNSGYGTDDISIPGSRPAWRDTSRAQATTLIPTRADTRFADLIRFEPYPDPFVDPYAEDPENDDDKAESLHTLSVNIGVNRGLAAGANLRPAEKMTVLEHTTESSPTLAVHADRLLIAWKGVIERLNVAMVQETRLLGIDGKETSLLGIDGVEGIERWDWLADTTESAPALASHNGVLVLAWRFGSGGDNQLKLAFSWDLGDTGIPFQAKTTLAESSEHSPALASHAGRLFLAWTGEDNEKLNVAQVGLLDNTPGSLGLQQLAGKVVLGDSSDAAPALASHNGRLVLAWKGSGNNQLNLAFSDDDGASFKVKTTLAEASSHGPSLASHKGVLVLAWKGSGNNQLNLAQVGLLGTTAGDFRFELEGKVVLGETSTEPPALISRNDRLFLAWKGESDDHLNLRVSRDGTFQAADPWLFSNLEHLGFFLAAYRTPPGKLPDDLDTPPDNLALVYAMEAGSMDFDRFKEETKARNSGLPARFDYGGVYQFHAPDDKRFSIWFQLTGQKYLARIVDLDDPNAVSDLSTLPLVSGEHMNALKEPSGHDGLIEIRHPGCDTPLTLDYRDVAHPVRLDNAQACPQPLVDRTRAIMAYAQDLISKAQAPLDPAKPFDNPLDALRTAVEVFRDFDPPAAMLSEYLLAYGQAIYALIAFLLGIGHLDEMLSLEVLSLVREAVSVELAASTAPGADVMRVAASLSALSALLSASGRPDEAALAQQAAVDVLMGFTPPAERRLEYLIALAEGRHNLIARLIDDRQVEQAATLVAETIAAYRDYVGQPGADVMRVARDLSELSALLTAAGRPDEAALAKRALDAMV
jgi:hypothetical protein